jgi:type VI secretion system Hcp family effector
MQIKFLKLFLILIINSTFASAQTILMEATGTVQGKFEGEVMQKGREKTSQITNYEFLAVSSTQNRSGGSSSSANRVLTITKEFDIMSLNFYKALVTNENIDQVTLNIFVQNKLGSGIGVETLALKIELTGVMVASYKQIGKTEGAVASGKPVDEIKLFYSNIKITQTLKNFVVGDK